MLLINLQQSFFNRFELDLSSRIIDLKKTDKTASNEILNKN